ncbi:MAG: IS1634 family transposase [Euryarchaeota archaeon]|nr:IS1634 family transposase [Euryarchaeota archaeon]
MKSKIRLKKINKKEYWYEDIPYYDKEKKQIRHHSRYLGKNMNGKPVKIREVMNTDTGSFLLPSRSMTSYGYGELLPVLNIIKDLHIDRYLGDLLPEQQRNVMLTMSISRMVRPIALHMLKTWYEGSFLSSLYPELPLSSQSISDLLEKIGESTVPSAFMGKLLQGVKTKSTLLYDCTSFSSYSHLIDLLEYGYSRDDADLPQINLSMIVDKKRGIPVMYDVYPGSIVDVTTLKNTIKKVEAFGVKDYTLILDRGFFSQGNIEELLDDHLSFIIPASLSLKEVKGLLSSAQKDIENPKYLQKFNKNPLFVKPVTLILETKRIQGFCYYDQKNEQSERHLFYARLYETKEHIEKKCVPSWKKPAAVFKERAGDMANYYFWHMEKDRQLNITIRKNAVAQRVNRMGKFFLFYSGKRDWMDCLIMYREKDLIEQGFKRLKQDLQALPLNTQKDSTTKGFLFICFISLIIRMTLIQQMKKTELIKEYTVEKLLMELEKMKKIRLANGEIITTELTKKQKLIIEQLHLCA